MWALLAALRFQASSPKTRISPDVVRSNPNRHLMRVDFPSPLVPTRPSTIPGETVRSTPFSTAFDRERPYDLCRLRTWMTASDIWHRFLLSDRGFPQFALRVLDHAQHLFIGQ